MHLIVLVTFYFIGNVCGQSGYSYADQGAWPRDFPTCGGRNQSPINIYYEDAVHVAIPPFKFFGYSRAIPGPMLFQHKDGSVDISISSLSGGSVPFLRNKYLKDEFVFDSFHFHWGSNDNQGSEHTLDGIRYPLELHIVHRRATYTSLQEAAQFEDGLLVLGVFYEVSTKDNAALEPILDMIRRNNTTNYLSSPVALRKLMGNINPKEYYTYFGSLTTPPCAEAVTWVVFPEPTKVSRRQLAVFRSAIGSDGQRIWSNFRFTQPLFGRPVYRSFAWPKRDARNLSS